MIPTCFSKSIDNMMVESILCRKHVKEICVLISVLSSVDCIATSRYCNLCCPSFLLGKTINIIDSYDCFNNDIGLSLLVI